MQKLFGRCIRREGEANFSFSARHDFRREDSPVDCTVDLATTGNDAILSGKHGQVEVIFQRLAPQVERFERTAAQHAD